MTKQKPLSTFEYMDRGFYLWGMSDLKIQLFEMYFVVKEITTMLLGYMLKGLGIWLYIFLPILGFWKILELLTNWSVTLVCSISFIGGIVFACLIPIIAEEMGLN